MVKFEEMCRNPLRNANISGVTEFLPISYSLFGVNLSLENSINLICFIITFSGTLGDEITNFGSTSLTNKSKKRKITPKKKGGGKKRKFI